MLLWRPPWVLAAVAMDVETEAMSSDTSKLPTILECKVFLEPSGKRRKKEPEFEDFAVARFELHFSVILIDLSRPLLAT